MGGGIGGPLGGGGKGGGPVIFSLGVCWGARGAFVELGIMVGGGNTPGFLAVLGWGVGLAGCEATEAQDILPPLPGGGPPPPLESFRLIFIPSSPCCTSIKSLRPPPALAVAPLK